jgi:hypothetical protein
MAGSGIGPSGRARTWAEDQTDRLREELPGWSCWPIGTYDRRIFWNAGPTGHTGNSTTSVITDEPNPEALIKAVRKYEEELERHIQDFRQLMALQPGTGYGRDRARAIGAQVELLEGLLKARQADGEGM